MIVGQGTSMAEVRSPMVQDDWEAARSPAEITSTSKLLDASIQRTFGHQGHSRRSNVMSPAAVQQTIRSPLLPRGSAISGVDALRQRELELDAPAVRECSGG